jgi:hypothetical protein
MTLLSLAQKKFKDLFSIGGDINPMTELKIPIPYNGSRTKIGQLTILVVKH